MEEIVRLENTWRTLLNGIKMGAWHPWLDVQRRIESVANAQHLPYRWTRTRQSSEMGRERISVVVGGHTIEFFIHQEYPIKSRLEAILYSKQFF